MSDIRIYLCCHSGYGTVPPLCQPVQCGAAVNPPVAGAVRDDVGDNISDKNPYYCELTAHYHAWKNVSADHYGFCHYRRFFCADETVRPPYIAVDSIRSEHMERLLGTERLWTELVGSYDIIAPRSEDMGLAAGEHYRTSRFHYAGDLELFIGILKERHPRFSEAADLYLSQNRQYFCNMFIMKKELFMQYCEVLFGILDEFDKRKTLHGSFQADRTDGYLGEIFTGIFITYCRADGARIKELARIDTGCSFGKRAGCVLLPPESRRRFLAKRLVKRIRKS